MKLLSLFLPFVFSDASADVCENSSAFVIKPDYCADVTSHAHHSNSWVCRNCFNIRLNFNLEWIGAVGKNFDGYDYVWMAFKNPVSVIKWAGPADSIVPDGTDDDGNYLFKIGFENKFNPGDNRVDVNIEFNDNEGEQKDTPQQAKSALAWVKTCPCGVGKADICDPTGMYAEDVEDVQGFWACDWKRKDDRMNKCIFTCHGDYDLKKTGKMDWTDATNNYTPGAKGRCFRAQGKKIQKQLRKERVIGKWIKGKNKDKVNCDL